MTTPHDRPGQKMSAGVVGEENVLIYGIIQFLESKGKTVNGSDSTKREEGRGKNEGEKEKLGE